MSDRLLKESDVLKAIDKRIEELSKDPVFIRKNGIIDIIGVKKHILAIPSAQPKQEWIPCEERLPEHERRRYWVCTDTQYQCECRWTNNIYGLRESDDWGWSIFDTPQYTKVLAWMPLPEPYQTERSE